MSVTFDRNKSFAVNCRNRTKNYVESQPIENTRAQARSLKQKQKVQAELNKPRPALERKNVESKFRNKVLHKPDQSAVQLGRDLKFRNKSIGNDEAIMEEENDISRKQLVDPRNPPN